MANYKMFAKSFKKMEDPVSSNNEKVKYVCYIKANSFCPELDNWMCTNPREQKMTTNVAQKIKESLEQNSNFHELNRGILISANSVKYDNQTKEIELELIDNTIHGNIDGGHTLRAILDINNKQLMSDDRYVFVEILTGIDSPVELAAARNTSVQVDLKSIEELQKSFDIIKDVLADLPFSSRIAYKMNEHYNTDIIPIDIREVISIILMFSQSIYPYKKTDGTLNDLQPIQCYTGKEASLKKFLSLSKLDRDNMIINMKPILKDIFTLWEHVETNYNTYALKAGKNLKNRKVIKSGKEIKSYSLFEYSKMDHIVPKGMLYPLISAFRALIKVNSTTNMYEWSKNPLEVSEKISSKLISIILDEKNDNPDAIGKNSNLWSNLFKEIYIIAYL